MKEENLLNEIIDRYESRYLGRIYEFAIIISPSGEIIVPEKTNSNPKQVFHTEEEKKLFPNNIYIHNHPPPRIIKDEKKREIYYYSFSSSDILLAFCRELSEIRAVDKEYRYSFKPKSAAFKREQFCKFFSIYTHEIEKQDDIIKSTYPNSESEEKDMDELWKYHNALTNTIKKFPDYSYSCRRWDN